jgi:hypothetical protein
MTQMKAEPSMAGFELGFQHRLQEFSSSLAKSGLDRVGLSGCDRQGAVIWLVMARSPPALKRRNRLLASS